VGDSIPQAVARAVYADLNARAQVTAGQLGGYTALTAEEGAAAAESNNGQLTRAWEIWRANARRGESV
jgi:HCOMODA/2-hydroxy-3-carboxy-muconic semialdehyde decarboxylase